MLALDVSSRRGLAVDVSSTCQLSCLASPVGSTDDERGARERAQEEGERVQVVGRGGMTVGYVDYITSTRVVALDLHSLARRPRLPGL